MFAYPVKEIENIYTGEHNWNNLKIEPGVIRLSEVDDELLDINAEFFLGDAEEFGFIINGQDITYNTKNNQLYTDDVSAALNPENGKIRLRILVDRVSIEIFANDGKVYMPVKAIYSKEEKGVKIFTKGSNTTINSLKVNQLKSIWN